MEKCLYCQSEIKSVEGKKPKQFCNGNCRNKYYYKLGTKNKEKKKLGRPKKDVPLFEHITTLAKSTSLGKEIMKKINSEPSGMKVRDISPTGEVLGTYDLIPPMPVKVQGENAIDFAQRKNEWKIKYGNQ